MAVAQQKPAVIILILGALTTISPFSIDMYLAAFPQIADDLHTPPARIALSLSSYFIGLAIGQIFCGPILDRHGRHRPLIFGLFLYVLASMGCVFSHSVEALIAFRFVQALGGSVASVASMAMVRDFFPVQESAKVFSLLMLVIGVSPLLAPTAGGFLATAFGWHSVFILLSVITMLILAASLLFLPAGAAPDHSVSLRPVPILKNFWAVFRHKTFFKYAVSGAFAFSSLFVYVASSPIVFMELYHVSPLAYGAIFACLAAGFIGGSQLNLLVSRHFEAHLIYRRGLQAQALAALLFLICALTGFLNLPLTILFFFLCLLSLGFSSPNGSALALAPFERNVGTASALLGSLQIALGALASAVVGVFASLSMVPAVSLLAIVSWIGLAIATRARE